MNSMHRKGPGELEGNELAHELGQFCFSVHPILNHGRIPASGQKCSLGSDKTLRR